MSEQPEEQPATDIWSATVDNGRFTMRVVPGETAYRGRLLATVTDTGEVLVEQDVVVAYGAVFGPDVEDVFEWQRITLAVIDAWLTERGEPIPTDE